jgi:hypothetical protein
MVLEIIALMSGGVVAGVEPLIGEARDRQRARRRRNALALLLLACDGT